MIIDSLKNWEAYKQLLAHYEAAMKFALSLTDSAPGRYDLTSLEEGEVYVLVQQGTTQPVSEGKIEAHRLYADVQILLEGGETVVYSDIEGLTEAVPYKEDIVFYEGAGQPIAIPAGSFYIALPQDGHMPCRHLGDTPNDYKKLVVKIRLK